VKYRKRPIIIEAEQFFPDQKPWPKGVWDISGGDYCAPCIGTLEGLLQVSPGDWIITGVQGEKYSCKPDIFEQTYEEVR